jgi:pilus assembly protein CpaD
VPTDYRQRHPIAVQEAKKSIVIFVGKARGGLSAAQHADVEGIARDWGREGTGSVVVDVPVDTANARAASATYQEIRSVLASGGVPSRAIMRHPYRPEDPGLLPTIRLGYSRIAAVAGPCGLWPEDVGPSILDPGYNENRPYFNLGCATQRNLAAMIDNPADLEQPRSETPVYTARRDIAFDRYRKGTPISTPNPDADKAKLSETGK